MCLVPVEKAVKLLVHLSELNATTLDSKENSEVSETNNRECCGISLMIKTNNSTHYNCNSLPPVREHCFPLTVGEAPPESIT